MARKRKSGVRTIDDVLAGEIPIACSCGQKLYFHGKGEGRDYLICPSCKLPTFLSAKRMDDAKADYIDEINRRLRALRDQAN